MFRRTLSAVIAIALLNSSAPFAIAAQPFPSMPTGIDSFQRQAIVPAVLDCRQQMSRHPFVRGLLAIYKRYPTSAKVVAGVTVAGVWWFLSKPSMRWLSGVAITPILAGVFGHSSEVPAFPFQRLTFSRSPYTLAIWKAANEQLSVQELAFRKKAISQYITFCELMARAPEAELVDALLIYDVRDSGFSEEQAALFNSYRQIAVRIFTAAHTEFRGVLFVPTHVRVNELEEVPNQIGLLGNLLENGHEFLAVLSVRLVEFEEQIPQSPDALRTTSVIERAQALVEVYGTAAEYFGFTRIPTYLQETVYQLVNPGDYERTVRLMEERVDTPLGEGQMELENIAGEINWALKKKHVKASVEWRVKSALRAGKKIDKNSPIDARTGLPKHPFHELFDTFGLRIVCEDESQVDQAIEIVWQLYPDYEKERILHRHEKGKYGYTGYHSTQYFVPYARPGHPVPFEFQVLARKNLEVYDYGENSHAVYGVRERYSEKQHRGKINLMRYSAVPDPFKNFERWRQVTQKYAFVLIESPDRSRSLRKIPVIRNAKGTVLRGNVADVVQLVDPGAIQKLPLREMKRLINDGERFTNTWNLLNNGKDPSRQSIEQLKELNTVLAQAALPSTYLSLLHASGYSSESLKEKAGRRVLQLLIAPLRQVRSASTKIKKLPIHLFSDIATHYNLPIDDFIQALGTGLTDNGGLMGDAWERIHDAAYTEGARRLKAEGIDVTRTGTSSALDAAAKKLPLKLTDWTAVVKAVGYSAAISAKQVAELTDTAIPKPVGRTTIREYLFDNVPSNLISHFISKIPDDLLIFVTHFAEKAQLLFILHDAHRLESFVTKFGKVPSDEKVIHMADYALELFTNDKNLKPQKAIDIVRDAFPVPSMLWMLPGASFGDSQIGGIRVLSTTVRLRSKLSVDEEDAMAGSIRTAFENHQYPVRYVLLTPQNGSSRLKGHERRRALYAGMWLGGLSGAFLGGHFAEATLTAPLIAAFLQALGGILTALVLFWPAERLLHEAGHWLAAKHLKFLNVRWLPESGADRRFSDLVLYGRRSASAMIQPIHDDTVRLWGPRLSRLFLIAFGVPFVFLLLIAIVPSADVFRWMALVPATPSLHRTYSVVTQLVGVLTGLLSVYSFADRTQSSHRPPYFAPVVDVDSSDKEFSIHIKTPPDQGAVQTALLALFAKHSVAFKEVSTRPSYRQRIMTVTVANTPSNESKLPALIQEIAAQTRPYALFGSGELRRSVTLEFDITASLPSLFAFFESKRIDVVSVLKEPQFYWDHFRMVLGVPADYPEGPINRSLPKLIADLEKITYDSHPLLFHLQASAVSERLRNPNATLSHAA